MAVFSADLNTQATGIVKGDNSGDPMFGNHMMRGIKEEKPGPVCLFQDVKPSPGHCAPTLKSKIPMGNVIVKTELQQELSDASGNISGSQCVEQSISGAHSSEETKVMLLFQTEKVDSKFFVPEAKPLLNYSLQGNESDQDISSTSYGFDNASTGRESEVGTVDSKTGSDLLQALAELTPAISEVWTKSEQAQARDGDAVSELAQEKTGEPISCADQRHPTRDCEGSTETPTQAGAGELRQEIVYENVNDHLKMHLLKALEENEISQTWDLECPADHENHVSEDAIAIRDIQRPIIFHDEDESLKTSTTADSTDYNQPILTIECDDAEFSVEEPRDLGNPTQTYRSNSDRDGDLDDGNKGQVEPLPGNQPDMKSQGREARHERYETSTDPVERGCYHLQHHDSGNRKEKEKMAHCTQPDHDKKTGKAMEVPRVSKYQTKTNPAVVKPYSCRVCGKSFKTNSSLTRHTKVHLKVRPHRCPVCKKCFKRRDSLHRHRERHLEPAEQVRYKCLLCNVDFHQKASLSTHIETHLRGEPKSYRCLLCNRSFNTKWYLRRHLAVHEGDASWKCPICNKQCMFESELKTHLLTHKKEAAYECDICYKTFKMKDHLNVHRKKHTGRESFCCHVCDARFLCGSDQSHHHETHHTQDRQFYTCNFCKKDFIKWLRFKAHIFEHTEERQYVCEVCGLRFPNKHRLQNHMWTHSNRKRYTCSFCSAGFNDHRSYSKHERSHNGDQKTCTSKQQFRSQHQLQHHRPAHDKENNKSFQCEKCEKRFKTKRSLKYHRLVHTDLKPFRCDVCGEAFNCKDKLSRHKWKHRDTKPFRCEVCDKSFHDGYSLTRHSKVHTDNTPYTCHVCGRGFKLKNYLHKHMFTHDKNS